MFSEESSPALGYGWRLGFLGVLHMEVFSQRLEQEYDAEVFYIIMRWNVYLYIISESFNTNI